MDEDLNMPTADEMMDDEVGIPNDGPVLKVGEEKEIGKRGLKKKLLKEGEGWETPENGDEVKVLYTGTSLDGTWFDLSRDWGMPFKFALRQDGKLLHMNDIVSLSLGL